MNLRRSLCLVCGALAAGAVLLGSASPVVAQNGGVIVDAGGTLRVTIVADPAGRLTADRIAAAMAHLDPDLARPSKRRMVSLTRLEREIERRLATGEGLNDDIRYLAGLTGIDYVFCYPDTGDIVIAGPAEGYMHDITDRVVGVATGRSTMMLEDLVVALRAFPPSGMRTGMIGCSIDPTPEGLAQLQQEIAGIYAQLAQLRRAPTPAETSYIVKTLGTALGLQTVSVQGVSDKTHFAQVLVEADYRMKLIGIGLEKPPVKITSYVEKANPRAVARNALQRWYFVPNYECIRESDDELAIELVGEGVKLVGANEVVTDGGTRVKSTIVDGASNAFVTTFTKSYPELAKRVPVYAQLQNLIDASIAAAYIQDRDLYAKARWDMRIFGSEAAFPVETCEAPKTVGTAINAVWKGNTLMTPIGGGVEMHPQHALRSDWIKPDEDGKLDATRTAIDLGTLEAGRWWWD